MAEPSLVEFFRLIPQARPPKRADRSAAGYIPSRAQRYCDALTTATGFGYWIFPPIDVRLLWTGDTTLWSYGEDESWLPLSETPSGAVQFPNFAGVFDAAAPEYLQGFSPPFLTAVAEAGTVQIWTGLLARTRPGWSLYIRPPVNLPQVPGLTAWEGVVETDIWFGPLFTNVRLTKTDQPINLRAQVPFVQVQTIPQLAYREETLRSFECKEMEGLEADDWKQLAEVLRPDLTEDADRAGHYAVKVRKRRSCPVASFDSLKPEPPIGS